AVGLCDPLDRAPDFGAIEVRGNRVVARPGKIDPAAFWIHVLQRAHFPLSRRDLALQVSPCVVMIHVLPSVAFAQPEEGTVVEPANRPRALDPGLRSISEKPLD